MKSFKIVAAMAIAAATFSACGNSSAPKADLKNDIDSVSYAVGLTNGQYMQQAFEQGQIDSTYMSEFVKGLNEGANAGDDKKKAAYIAGLQIGQQLSSQMVKGLETQLFAGDSTQHISMKNLLAGFITSATKKKGLMEPEAAMQFVQTKMNVIQAANMEKQYGPNKKAGEKFMADNKQKAGIVTLPSGVQYKVIKEGKGEMPKDTSRVTVHYEGKTIDGKVFDSSYQRKQPATMQANQVIKGWTEALTHMPVGSTWEVYIPQELAYGARQAGDIKPFSALIFKIELVKIEK